MILVSTQCFPPKPGGIEILMHALCAQLVNRGHALRVFADAGAAQDRGFDRSCAFPIQRFGGIKPWRRRTKAHAVKRYLEESGADVLLTDSWKSLELLAVSAVPRIVCLAHGMEFPLQPSATKTARIVNSLARTSAIVANSAYTADRVAGYIGIDKRIHVIHPGISPPAEVDAQTRASAAQAIAGRAPVLISLARLEPRKGLDLALGIMPALLARYPRLLYIIAGEGSQRTRLELAASGFEDHVLFCGRLAEPLKSAYLQASDVFLLPGTSAGDDIEGFGMAYIEAASHGLPAIAGRSGGAVEAVLHEQTGIVCNARNKDELLTAVSGLLDNPERRRQLGENARERSEQFLWPNRIRDYEQLLLPLESR
jgi:phosphatidylinositol alpha-1,6-mannosyltransferase